MKRSIIISLLFLAWIPCALSMSKSLFPERAFEVGLRPFGVVHADFDGDGLLDLATADSASEEISILLNEGDRVFSPRTPIAVGSYIQYIATGDFNDDDHVDLVVVATFDHQIVVFLGHGDGRFSAPSRFTTGLFPQAVVAGDFDEDGSIDLAAANGGTGDISLLPGAGDGTFGPAVAIEVGDSPDHLAVEDLDGDGHVDLVVVKSFDSGLSVLLGRGDGTFTVSEVATPRWVRRFVAVGHLDGDGRPDLVLMGAYSSEVVTYQGLGDGTFSAPKVLQAGSVNVGVAISDLNTDGASDLVVANWDGLSLLKGREDGTFDAEIHLRSGAHPEFINVGDLDSDGWLDAFSTNWMDSDVSILYGSEDGLIMPEPFLPLDGRRGGAEIITRDFNGDGRSDLAIPVPDEDTIALLWGRKGGSFEPGGQFPTGVRPTYVTSGDYNGDGHHDLVVVNAFSEDLSLLLGGGDGVFMPERREILGEGPRRPITIDLNGDDLDDVALCLPRTDEILILFGDRDVGLSGRKIVPAGNFPGNLASGDINGDGQVDLVTANSYSADLSLLLGRVDGTLATEIRIPYEADSRGLDVGDLNGDGTLDIALIRQVIGGDESELSILFGLGDGTFPRRMNFPLVGLPQDVKVTDINADGLPDLLVIVGGSVRPNRLKVIPALGEGRFGIPELYRLGSLPISLTEGDFNLDGREDLAVLNTASNDVAILLNQGPFPPQPYKHRTGIAAGKLLRPALATSLPEGQPIAIGDPVGCIPAATETVAVALELLEPINITAGTSGLSRRGVSDDLKLVVEVDGEPLEDILAIPSGFLLEFSVSSKNHGLKAWVERESGSSLGGRIHMIFRECSEPRY